MYGWTSALAHDPFFLLFVVTLAEITRTGITVPVSSVIVVFCQSCSLLEVYWFNDLESEQFVRDVGY